MLALQVTNIPEGGTYGIKKINYKRSLWTF